MKYRLHNVYRCYHLGDFSSLYSDRLTWVPSAYRALCIQTEYSYYMAKSRIHKGSIVVISISHNNPQWRSIQSYYLNFKTSVSRVRVGSISPSLSRYTQSYNTLYNIVVWGCINTIYTLTIVFTNYSNRWNTPPLKSFRSLFKLLQKCFKFCSQCDLKAFKNIFSTPYIKCYLPYCVAESV